MSWALFFERCFDTFLRALSEGTGEGPRRSQVTVTVRPGPPPLLVVPADTDRTATRAVGVQTTPRTLVVGPSEILRIEPPPRAAWDERGWRSTEAGGGLVYEGEYHVTRAGQPQRFTGRIVMKNGAVTPYIANPPTQIRRHPKGPCFQLSNAPWFRVHWYRPAANVDDALLYVERVLYEALN